MKEGCGSVHQITQLAFSTNKIQFHFSLITNQISFKKTYPTLWNLWLDYIPKTQTDAGDAAPDNKRLLSAAAAAAVVVSETLQHEIHQAGSCALKQYHSEYQTGISPQAEVIKTLVKVCQ